MSQDKALVRHFGSYFRTLAGGKSDGEKTSFLKHISRKDLIQVVKEKHKGKIPDSLNLLEMEKEEIFKAIGDEMYLVAFIAKRWCTEPPVITNDKKVKANPKASGKESKSV